MIHSFLCRSVIFGVGRWVALAVIAGATLGGCSSFGGGSDRATTGNPLLDLRDPDLVTRQRIAAAEQAWEEVESGVRVRGRTREAFKSLAWSRSTDPELRLALIGLLAGDDSPEGSADSESMARLMLPTERSPDMIRLLSSAAVEREWTGVVPALVRSYARVSPNVPDDDRPERAAIVELSGTSEIDEAVFGVFLRPGAGLGGDREDAVLRARERVRLDAWTLLSRLDSGGAREALLGRGLSGDVDAESAVDVEVLRDGLADLGALPSTGEELAWLRRLRANEDSGIAARNDAWWGETARAIRRLGDEQRAGLEIRHAEAIRWAAANRADWFGASRSELMGALAGRLDDRPRQQRDGEKGKGPIRERLSEWASRMSWADVLTVLVVDDALAQEQVRRAIFEQAGLDRADKTTEYGGVIESSGGGMFRAVLFRPRARDRMDDTRFVASGDMLRFSDRGLVHYHMQVQRKRLSKLAGPSAGDFLYAQTSGRTCLVFTSIGSDLLNVDIYTPNGEVIDLGMIEG